MSPSGWMKKEQFVEDHRRYDELYPYHYPHPPTTTTASPEAAVVDHHNPVHEAPELGMIVANPISPSQIQREQKAMERRQRQHCRSKQQRRQRQQHNNNNDDGQQQQQQQHVQADEKKQERFWC